MSTWRTKLPVVLVLALTVPLLLGCASATPDPIRIGSAPAEPTGKLNLDLAVRPSGYVEASRLPDACDLRTDRDLRAVFPQAEGIERDAEDRRLVVTDPPSSSDPYPSGRGVRLKNEFCTTAFSLPGVERGDPPGLWRRGYEVTVRSTRPAPKS